MFCVSWGVVLIELVAQGSRSLWRWIENYHRKKRQPIGSMA